MNEVHSDIIDLSMPVWERKYAPSAQLILTGPVAEAMALVQMPNHHARSLHKLCKWLHSKHVYLA